MHVTLLLLLEGLLYVGAQQAGEVAKEAHPSISFRHCTSSATGAPCREEELEVTLDAQYRWVHDAEGYDNCFDGGNWDEKLCPSGKACAANCAIDGVDKDGYPNTYGVAETSSGIELTFAVKGEYGTNYGSRVYVLDGESKYKMFKLKNREFSFDVDMSNLPCGLNGAAYFVAMDEKGEYGKGQNDAGAKYGLGYCDAQCPRGQKFVLGEANIDGWDSATNEGKVGSCCAELDLFEANANSSAMTVHPCSSAGPTTCEEDECGGDDICDKDGCQYNPFHMGNPMFYGPGEEFTVDTTRPFTVVTQFFTDDGTDAGDLSEIRRFYRQGGKTFPAPNVKGPEKKENGVEGNSISEEYCTAKNGDKLFSKGGDYMKKMGDAMDRGMVLILSVWDDPATNMAWLDASSLVGQSESGSSTQWNGPCYESSEDIRTSHPDSSVKFENFVYGDIFSTCPSCKDDSQTTARSTTEEPVIVTTQSTQPPLVFDKTSTTSPSVQAPPPLYTNPLFVVVAIFAGVVAAAALGWTWVKAQGWELNFNRQPGGAMGPASPNGASHLVRPSE